MMRSLARQLYSAEQESWREAAEVPEDPYYPHVLAVRFVLPEKLSRDLGRHALRIRALQKHTWED